jgi:integrase
MSRLTKRTVDAEKSRDRDRFLWDDDLPGFGLRVYPSGAKVYLCQWKRDGRTRRLVLGRHGPVTCEQARAAATAALGRVASGEDPAQEREDRKRDLTVAELCDRWLAAGCPRAKPGRDGTVLLKAGSASAYRSAIKRHIRPLLGHRKLTSLKSTDLTRFQSDVAAGRTAVVEKTGARGLARVTGGRGVAGRCAAYLAAIFSWAAKQGFMTSNPAAGLEVIPSGQRKGSLSAEELEKLGEALAVAEVEGVSPVLLGAIRLLAFTGCRRNEVLRLRWPDVDLTAGVLRLPDSKTGAKLVPLTAPARDLLESLPRQDSPWVFPASRGKGPAVGLNKVFRAIRERAGIDPATVPHTLRHTLATTAVHGNASLYLVGKVLGHASARTTERYSHAALDPVAAVAEAASKQIASSIRAGEAKAREKQGGTVIELRSQRGRKKETEGSPAALQSRRLPSTAKKG